MKTILKKVVISTWANATQKSFENLKIILFIDPILRIPNFTKTFILTIDTSKLDISSEVHHEQKSIAY